tara:strand:+ start:200 stop:349 length:150 start_codon:yes stop_codon:yes gene_type:complete
MFLINIAEWCINALVLSMAFFLSAVAAFIFAILTSLIKDICVKKYNKIT